MRTVWMGILCGWLLFGGGVFSADKDGNPILFDTGKLNLFPSWKATDAGVGAVGVEVKGMIGGTKARNIEGSTEKGEKILFHYIPTLINILLKFAAPIILVIFLWAGIRLVYHSDNDDDVEKSKMFFMYALMGVLFIVLSYSLLKVLYFLLAP